MAISVTNGFEVKAKQAIDTRILLTKEQMVGINDKVMPEIYFAICSDDGKLYIYNKLESVNSDTGKFKPYEQVIDLPQAMVVSMQTPEGKKAMEEAISPTLPGAISGAMESPEMKSSMEAAVGQTVPGALADAMQTEAGSEKIAQSLFSGEHFGRNIDNKIDLQISLIQAVDCN